MLNCAICSKPILGKYLVDSNGRSCHESHNGRTSITCKCCYSLSDPNECIKYSDGRRICKLCHLSAVNDPINGRISKQRVFTLFERANLVLPRERIQLSIIDLNFFRQNQGSYSDNLVGLTRINTRYSWGTWRQPKKHYEVYILSGLSHPIFLGVLAHELMHVYLSENDFNLSLMEEEGLCELINYFMLQCYSNSKLAKSHLDRMLNNPDPIYGDGFRMTMQRLENYSGIHELLQSLQGGQKLWTTR
jgi:hypothetical protein